MKLHGKRILSWLLCVTLLLGCFPFTAVAEEEPGDDLKAYVVGIGDDADTDIVAEEEPEEEFGEEPDGETEVKPEANQNAPAMFTGSSYSVPVEGTDYIIWDYSDDSYTAGEAPFFKPATGLTGSTDMSTSITDSKSYVGEQSLEWNLTPSPGGSSGIGLAQGQIPKNINGKNPTSIGVWLRTEGPVSLSAIYRMFVGVSTDEVSTTDLNASNSFRGFVGNLFNDSGFALITNKTPIPHNTWNYIEFPMNPSSWINYAQQSPGATAAFGSTDDIYFPYGSNPNTAGSSFLGFRHDKLDGKMSIYVGGITFYYNYDGETPNYTESMKDAVWTDSAAPTVALKVGETDLHQAVITSTVEPIAITVADTGSGVNNANLSVKLNGTEILGADYVTVTGGETTTDPTTIEIDISDLTNNDYELVVTAWDNFGFRTVETAEFEINFNTDPAYAETLATLTELIAKSQARHNAAIEPSTNVTAGRYSAADKATFQAAINKASDVLSTDDLLESVAQGAINALNTAIAAFKASMIELSSSSLPAASSGVAKLGPYMDTIEKGQETILKEHLRATWVASVVNIDWPSAAARGTTPDKITLQKQELVKIFDNAKNLGMNAIIFQVRPTSDAMFLKGSEPLSYWLTGELNYPKESFPYDPLALAVELAHERNMELHAWFNPYRCSMPASLYDSSISTLNDIKNIRGAIEGDVFDRFGEHIYTGNSARWVVDPSIPEVRAYVQDRIMEVVNNYDIDAIHFDDYFYPENGSGDTFNDDAQFASDKYNSAEHNLISKQKITNKADWRRENTEMLILELSELIKAAKPYVKFGISPGGIWRSATGGSTGLDNGGIDSTTGSISTSTFTNYDSSYADTRKWVVENYIDYIVPQIYWDFGQNTAPYGPIADWWSRLVKDYGPGGSKSNSQGKQTNTQLYIGMGLYRMDPNEGAQAPLWNNSFEGEGTRELMRQANYNIGNDDISGSILYTSKSTMATGNGIPETMDELTGTAWQYPALVPAMPSLGGKAPANPTFSAAGSTVTWTNVETSTSEMIKPEYFVIYRSEETPVDITDSRNIVAKIPAVQGQANYSYTATGGSGDNFVVTAVNRLHDESDPSSTLPTPDGAPTITNVQADGTALAGASISGPEITITADVTSTLDIREIKATLTKSGGPAIDVTSAVRILDDSLSLFQSLPAGSYTLELTAIDMAGTQSAKVTTTFTVTGPAAPTIDTTSLPGGTYYLPYRETLTATSTTDVTWSVSAGNLPAGLSLNSTTGVISGEPTQHGTFNFTVAAANEGGITEKQLSIVVAPPAAPTITTTTLEKTALNTPYNVELAATSDYDLTWSISGGKLPAGLTLNRTTGVISGRPTVYNNTTPYTFTVKAENPHGGFDTQELSILVESEPDAAISSANVVRWQDFEDGQGIVKTDWGEAVGNSEVGRTTLPTDKTNTSNASNTFAGIHSLNWQIDHTSAVGPSLSAAEAYEIPKQSGANPTGIGFWMKVSDLSAADGLNLVYKDRPLRMGLLVDGAYNWWEVPVYASNAWTITANEWAWIEVDLTARTYNVSNGDVKPAGELPSGTLAVPGTGTGNANAFLYWRKTSTSQMQANIQIDNITFLYNGATGADANYDTEPPVVTATYGKNTVLTNSVPRNDTLTVSISDMESGIDASKMLVELNGADITNSAVLSAKGIYANISIAANSLLAKDNVLNVTVYDKFGFVTVKSYKFNLVAATDNTDPPSSGNNNTSSGNNGNVSSGTDTTDDTSSPDSAVIVDGKAISAGEVTVNEDTTTVTVDQATIQNQLETATDNVTIIIPAETGTAVAELVLKNVEDMADKGMTLTVQAGNVQYELPASAIDTAAVLSELGTDSAAGVPISITVTMDVSAAVQARVDDAMEANGSTLIIPPMEFGVTATYNGKTVEIDTFSQYVSRAVEITAEQAGKITTAAIVEPNGTMRQVPTRVHTKSGKWYSEINSLTNSTYVLISNEKAFADAENKWYESAVNEMGSRMIISGVGNDMFDGDRDITRAEFAAIIIRALGLSESSGNAVFTDVSSSAWYYGAVSTAYKYGIISGIGDNKFAPEQKITRQEAMVMIQRAAKVTSLTGQSGSLTAFADASAVSDWALDAAKWNVGSSLIVGSDGKLNPLSNITRAETSTLVLKLMQRSSLIDIRTKF